MGAMKKKWSLCFVSVVLVSGIVLLYLEQFMSKVKHSTNPCPKDPDLEKRLTDLVSFSNTPADDQFKENQDWKTFTKALNEYKVFHKTKLQQLKTSPNDKSVKTLTWACVHKYCSGIGDQLLRIQFFLLLAIMSDRLYTIHFDKKLQEMTKYVIPNEVDWTYFNRSIGMCDYIKHPCSPDAVGFESTSIWNFGWSPKEFSNFAQILFSDKQHITVTGTVFVDVMTIGKSQVNMGELITNGLKKLGVKQLLSQTPSDTVNADHQPLYYTVFYKLGVHHLIDISEVSDGKFKATNAWIRTSHTIFTYLFGFSQSLITEVTKYQKSLGLYNKDYLAVHVRTGFIGTEDEESLTTQFCHGGHKLFTHSKDWRCIIQHGIDLRDKTLGSNASIYLSTDSYLVKDMVLKDFRDKHIVFGDLSLVHSRNEHTGCEAKNKDMWFEFLTLANATRIVHGTSTFSITSTFLKPIPHLFHSWILEDIEKNCLASHIAGHTNCICS